LRSLLQGDNSLALPICERDSRRNMPGGAHENMRGWSPEEDELLLELIQISGKRWKHIAEALGAQSPGTPRTPAMVRNRFLRIERGRQLTEQGKSKNRCGQCGQLKRGHVCQAPRALVSTSLQAQEARHEAARLKYGDAFASPALVIGCIEPTAAAAPPMLRTQDSMEILARACETQPLAADAGLFDNINCPESRVDGISMEPCMERSSGTLEATLVSPDDSPPLLQPAIIEPPQRPADEQFAGFEPTIASLGSSQALGSVLTVSPVIVAEATGVVCH